ncbi:MAG: PHP domain-containing protein [Marinisporobacter sp.]|jgi:PHP family Zn ribbon phosphoesterase|nr:PHP domain-containing protein [Marinisporobacter sp.]
MKIAVDFHIHTGLSPCADEDMTPNNIVNMSMLKGLDAIAITDHNTAENCKACLDVAKSKGLIVVPGMELQTKEEVHLICLFKGINEVLSFQQLVYDQLPEKENDPKVFGKQLVFNEKDEAIRENKRMLIISTSLSLNEVFYEVEKREGVIIPAHVDRGAYSLIGTLGFVPKQLEIKTLEISRRCNLTTFLEKYKYLKRYKFIQSSDAHYLGDILERENFIEVEEKTIEGIFRALR